MPIAIISDIHANTEAFSAVLSDIKKRKINKIFCLGDIVDYGAEPVKCIELIKKHSITSIMGNHDLTAVNFERLEWYNEIAQESVKKTHKLLSRDDREFLLGLPKFMTYKNIFMVHGSPRDYLYGYVYPDISQRDMGEFFSIAKKEIILLGHTHMPFIKKYKNKLLVNVGSVGQPRDGNPKACYCILDNTKMEAQIIRISYDIKSSADKMSEACRFPPFGLGRLASEHILFHILITNLRLVE